MFVSYLVEQRDEHARELQIVLQHLLLKGFGVDTRVQGGVGRGRQGLGINLNYIVINNHDL